MQGYLHSRASRFESRHSSERRRVALWRVLEALRGDAGPLAPSRPRPTRPPLPAMSRLETTDADYRLTGLSLNGHPMRHLRTLLHPNGVRTSRELQQHGRDGERVAHAGLVICRQRPGTAKGFVFLSLEDDPRRWIFQGVHRQRSLVPGEPWTDGPRSSVLVFIGTALPRAVLDKGLEKCAAGTVLA